MPTSKLRTVDLTNGERLFVWRRRKELDQVAAAKEWGVSPTTYRRWEADEANPKPVPLGKLQTCEGLTIMRRRRGITQEELAQRVGVSRHWLRLMENGSENCERLTEWWAT